MNCFEYKLHADEPWMRVIPFNKILFVDYLQHEGRTKVDIFLDVDNTGLMESPFPKPHFSFDDDDAVAFLSAYKKWIDY